MAAAPANLPFAALVEPVRHAGRELAAVGYFSPDWRLLAARHLVGGVDWVAVPPRTVARDVLAFDAARVVLAHGHPSGDPAPSEADIHLTRRLVRALHALGVELFDHLIVGDRVTSLRAAGLL